MTTTATLHAKRLSTYLNDHLAAATGITQLAKRTLGSNEGTTYGPVLRQIAEEIEEDKGTLTGVMDRLGVDKNSVKVSLGWMAEKMGRLKLNDQLTGYSPLSRVVELEGLLAGIAVKRSLWLTLDELQPSDDRLAGIDFAQLAERAERQRTQLEEQRRSALREALLA